MWKANERTTSHDKSSLGLWPGELIKSISFILRTFTILESQNIIWTSFQKSYHLDPLSKENLDRGSPFQNGWKQNAFHSFWELLPFLNPKILSGPPVKQKFGQGFPLYFTFSEWLKTKSISFILRIFTFLESQNIIWTPFQTHIG